MRENPLVCLEVDEVRGHDDWASFVVFGQYVEIPNTREYAKSREHVRSLLQKRSLWWQSGEFEQQRQQGHILLANEGNAKLRRGSAIT